MQNNNVTKTILFLINGLGIASKDSFDIKFGEVMPNLSMLMGNYIYTNLENLNYNYKNGYRNFSLGNDLLPTYHRLEQDTNLMNNPTILNMATDAIRNGTKIHLFCFLDNEQVINQVIKIIDILRQKGTFGIFIHTILRQKDIIEYDNILDLLKKLEEKLTLYNNVEIGIVAGERTVNKDNYFYLFSKGLGEKWPDYARKLNFEKTAQVVPRQLPPFYIHPNFKAQANDIALFLNYEDVDCSEFIKQIKNIKLYTLFPMKAFSYAINIYEELEPTDYFNKKLLDYNLKGLVLTKKDRIDSINYNLNGLKEAKCEALDFSEIDNKDLDIEKILSSNYDLIIFDYDLDTFKEIAKMKEFLMQLDDKIDLIYNLCDQNGYNMFISSVYGIYKEDFKVGVSKNVKLDYSLEVPAIMIDQNYSKAKYFLKYGNTYNLSNTIFSSMVNDPKIPTQLRKRGLLSIFKD